MTQFWKKYPHFPLPTKNQTFPDGRLFCCDQEATKKRRKENKAVIGCQAQGWGGIWGEALWGNDLCEGYWKRRELECDLWVRNLIASPLIPVSSIFHIPRKWLPGSPKAPAAHRQKLAKPDSSLALWKHHSKLCWPQNRGLVTAMFYTSESIHAHTHTYKWTVHIQRRALWFSIIEAERRAREGINHLLVVQFILIQSRWGRTDKM